MLRPPSPPPQPHWFFLTSSCYGDLPQRMPIEREIKGQDHSLQGQERVPMGRAASQTLVTLPDPDLPEQCGHSTSRVGPLALQVGPALCIL